MVKRVLSRLKQMGRGVSKWVRYDEPPGGEGPKSEYGEILSKPRLLYVTRVGGDHMAGRFLSPAFTLSVLSITTIRFEKSLYEKVLVVLFVVAASLSIGHPMLTNSRQPRRKLDNAGIVDDRNFAMNNFALLTRSLQSAMVANHSSETRFSVSLAAGTVYDVYFLSGGEVVATRSGGSRFECNTSWVG